MAERVSELSSIKFDELPLSLAVKQVRGNGKRILAIFTDPNAPTANKRNRIFPS
jgi:thiol:disulfide interchange protein DsbC